MTARPRGFLQRHNSGRGNCGLSTAAWDLVHRESDTRLEHTHVQTDMAQLCPDKALPSLSKRGQGLAAFRSNLLVSLTSRPLFSLRLIPSLGLLTE